MPPLARLRPDVELVPNLRRGQPLGTAVIRDPKTGEVFEMGQREYEICRALDGETPLEAIRDRVERLVGGATTLEEVEAVVRQLDFHGFLAAPVTLGMLHNRLRNAALIPLAQYPLLDPDRFLIWLHARTGWLFTPAFVVFSLATIAFGAYLLVAHWERLAADMWAMWTPAYLPVVAAVGVLGVQATHELAHGLVATHYGGHVTRAGVMVVYRVLPKLYLERQQTAMILTRTRFARTYVHLVGLHVQLLLGSVGVVGAVLLSAPEGPAYWFWTALWSTAAWGALHNANLAHRRDAYFAMTTWLGLPNLRERAVVAMLNWVGRRPQPEPLAPRERRWFILYAVAAVGYYVVHGLVLLWSFGGQITEALEGPGLVVLGLLVLYALHVPLLRRARRPVGWLLASQAGSAKRWLVRLGWVALIVVILLIPYPYETGGPFTVLPAAEMQVHCEIDGGRIDKVLVREGQRVTAGQPLAIIDRREYEKNVTVTQAQLDETRAHLALLRKQLVMLVNPPNIEQVQALEAEVRRLEAQLGDYRRQLELTVLRAPADARVTTPQIDQKVGQYLKKGDLFATVEQAQAVRVEIQVPEGDAPLVRLGAGVKVVPWAYPGETFAGSVAEVAPVAAVPPGSKVNSVRVVAELPNPDHRLRSQITGYAKIRTRTMLFGAVLSRLVVRWFQVQFWYWLP